MSDNTLKGIQHIGGKLALNRRRLLKHGGVAALASAISLTPFTPIHAAGTPEQSNIEIKPLPGTKAQQYIQEVLASQDYLRFEQEISQNYAKTFTVTKTGASAVEVVFQGKSLIVTKIPLGGGANNSFYGATLSPDTGTILLAISSLFTFTAEGHIYAVGSRDGHVAFEGTLSHDGGTIIQGTLHTLNTTKTVQGSFMEVVPQGTTQFWSCMNSCLKGIGVNSGVIGVAIGICSSLCETSKIVCSTCFITAVGVLAAGVGSCVVGCASSYGL